MVPSLNSTTARTTFRSSFAIKTLFFLGMGSVDDFRGNLGSGMSGGLGTGMGGMAAGMGGKPPQVPLS